MGKSFSQKKRGGEQKRVISLNWGGDRKSIVFPSSGKRLGWGNTLLKGGRKLGWEILTAMTKTQYTV